MPPSIFPGEITQLARLPIISWVLCSACWIICSILPVTSLFLARLAALNVQEGGLAHSLDWILHFNGLSDYSTLAENSPKGGGGSFGAGGSPSAKLSGSVANPGNTSKQRLSGSWDSARGECFPCSSLRSKRVSRRWLLIIHWRILRSGSTSAGIPFRKLFINLAKRPPVDSLENVTERDR